LRIFIAALLPEEILSHINSYQISLRDRIQGVKWESSNKLHITLKFLGDIEEMKLSELKNIVSSSTLGRPKMTLRLSRFGGFPNLSRPRILYVGFSESDQIADLHSSIDFGLSEVGIEKDNRKFIPHVTIARVKSKFKIDAPLPLVEEKIFFIQNIAIVRSFIDNKGSKYKNLEVYKLN
jgi:2'-5' RNA ligase